MILGVFGSFLRESGGGEGSEKGQWDGVDDQKREKEIAI